MSKDEIAQLIDLRRLIYEIRHEMAAKDFVELRQQFGGHMVQLELSVLVPVCYMCGSERSFPYVYCELKEVSWLTHPGWETDLLTVGADLETIEQLKEDIEEGVDPVRGPWCYACHQWLPYWHDEDAACIVYSLPFKSYFGFTERESPHVGAKFKQVVRELYNRTCFGCGRELTDDEMTVDHVVAKDLGGSGEGLNLQLLCFECNQTKANQPVDVIPLTLHFPLRPVPSDAYEGVTW